MYLLDANIFIQAKNFYYRFDTFPGFWDWLDKEQASGQLASVYPIYEELAKGNDELADWVKDRKDTGWFPTVEDQSTQQEFIKIANWVMVQPFKEHAKEDFLGGGDPWLIAKAITQSSTIVTHEKFDALSKRKIFIPNVCREFSIPYIDAFDLMQKLKASFTLK